MASYDHQEPSSEQVTHEATNAVRVPSYLRMSHQERIAKAIAIRAMPPMTKRGSRSVTKVHPANALLSGARDAAWTATPLQAYRRR